MHEQAASSLIHRLNQRYKEAWERAERLQAELDDIRGSRAWTLLGWLRSLKARLCRQTSTLSAPAWPTQIINDVPEAARGNVAWPGIHSGRADAENRPDSDGMNSVPRRPLDSVSLIVPFKNQARLLTNLLRSLRLMRYKRFEVVLVDNGSDCPHTRRLLERLAGRKRLSVVASPGAFNFSRLCAAGARQARGRFLLFLNNDIEVFDGDWLGGMLRVAAHPQVGVVGGTLLYPDGTLQHAGVFPEGDGRWSHVYRGRAASDPGDDGELRHVRAVPAVTGACLLLRRRLFEELGGFREDLPVTGNDVDLCCRVRATGLLVAVTPHARLIHYESLSRGYARDGFLA